MKPRPPPIPMATNVIASRIPMKLRRDLRPSAEPIISPCASSPAKGRQQMRALHGLEPIPELLSEARLLDFHDSAAAAIGNPRFRNLVIGNRVATRDIERPNDARDVQHAQFVIHPHF